MSAPDVRGRSVFVTGAYGLVGSRLSSALVERGAQVTVLKRDGIVTSALALEGTERRVNVVHGDICDGALIENALAEHGVEDVFHLAAQTIVGSSIRSPASTFETNIRGTWTLLEACRQAAVSRVVVASSDKAYGPDQPVYREELALTPRNPYEVSKAAADMIARSYWHTFGLPIVVTRLANVYGGGDFNVSRLVPECALAAIEGRQPVLRSDGSAERDFLYVEDAVEAYLAIWGLLEAGRGAGEAFNAGGDDTHSILEVAQLTCQVSGTGVLPDVRGIDRPGPASRQWVDSTKLRQLSGWAPRVSLEDGLTRTVAWYRRYRQ